MSPGPASETPRPWARWRIIGINLLLAATLLFTLSFLPPDNSLSEVSKSGMFRVCLPSSAPPLVLSGADRPGYDVELLGLVAEDLGVRLATNINPAIGSDFNVRNWRLNRAQCSIIAGGVVDDATTRGFLQLLPTGALNGWARLTTGDGAMRSGQRVGVFPGPSSLDRLQLSRHLRDLGVEVVAFPTLADLLAALNAGEIDSAVTDYLTLAGAEFPDGSQFDWVFGGEQGRFNLGFGLWKGDATLYRAVQQSLLRLDQDGTKAMLAERYGLTVQGND